MENLYNLYPIDSVGLAKNYFLIYGLFLARYLILVGIAYLVTWVLLAKKLQHRLIQGKKPELKKILFEVRYSLLSFFLFGLSGVIVIAAQRSGHTLIYGDLDEYGMGYFLFSLLAMIVIHDAYFYWAHRLMHHPLIYKRVHLVHHKSTNPSPWASFSFHPTEAVLEAAIMPLLVFTLPLHSMAIFIFLLYMTLLNLLGHLGYELFPAGFSRHPVLGLHNTATHHNMHHKYVECNYSLYFNYWDRIMGTMHPLYNETFDEVKGREPIRDGDLKKASA